MSCDVLSEISEGLKFAGELGMLAGLFALLMGLGSFFEQLDQRSANICLLVLLGLAMLVASS